MTTQDIEVGWEQLKLLSWNNWVSLMIDVIGKDVMFEYLRNYSAGRISQKVMRLEIENKYQEEISESFL